MTSIPVTTDISEELLKSLPTSSGRWQAGGRIRDLGYIAGFGFHPTADHPAQCVKAAVYGTYDSRTHKTCPVAAWLAA